MIPLKEIKKELLSVLKGLYQDGYAFYGREVTEGYGRPSFFTQLLPVSSEAETMWVKDRAFIFEITYFQKEPDEADALQKISEIEGAFGNKVKIKDRYANVTEFEYGFTGRMNDIPQARVEFSFKDAAWQKADDAVPARNVAMKVEMEG